MSALNIDVRPGEILVVLDADVVRLSDIGALPVLASEIERAVLVARLRCWAERIERAGWAESAAT